jgi:hypothetical protein
MSVEEGTLIFLPYTGFTTLIPCNFDHLPALKKLTLCYRQLETSLEELAAAKRCLGQAKSELLEDQFSKKHPNYGKKDTLFNEQTDADWHEMYARRIPYQQARLQYRVAIATVRNFGLELADAVKENVSLLKGISIMAEECLRDEWMSHSIEIANNLLCKALTEHGNAINHLAEQPNPECGILGMGTNKWRSFHRHIDEQDRSVDGFTTGFLAAKINV